MERNNSLIKYMRDTQTPSIYLHLIFEISSLKNQVRRTGFFVYFELDFYCLCSLQKSSLKKTKNPVRRTGFFKLEISKSSGDG